MAYGGIKKLLSQQMECDICMEQMDDAERRPKILPCGHTFCLRCLNGQRNNVCADCREVFQGSAADLPNNFFVLRLSDGTPAPAPRSWCRECGKEATEVCLDEEHRVCSLRKIRAEQRHPRLDALRRGEASLDELWRSVEKLAPDLGIAVAECEAVLKGDQDDVAAKRRRLQAAQGADQAAWEKAIKAAEPSALSERAGHLLDVLADPTSSCSVAVRGGGVAWRTDVDLKDAVAWLLLCRLLCAGKLEPEERPRPGPEGAAAALRWQENGNELSVQEMAARMRVGSRVMRGRDWLPHCGYDGVPWAPTRGAPWATSPGVWAGQTGHVTRFNDDGKVFVKWPHGPNTLSTKHAMGHGRYELQLLGTSPPWQIAYEPGEHVLSFKSASDWMDFKNLDTPAAIRMLEKVRILVGLSCWDSSTKARDVLRTVSPNLEILSVANPEEKHLEVVRAMPKLRELHVNLIMTTHQHVAVFKAVLQIPQLRRLQVNNLFRYKHLWPLLPLPPAMGLQWLRVGFHPLATALALVRANADTLEELELVAASTLPYGCSDLAGELRRCAPRRLRRLVLLRESFYCVCRHDMQTCSKQKMDILNALMEVTIVRQVLCSLCDQL